MKIMKTILFAITMIASAQVFAMEAPPQAPVQATQVKPLLPLKELPADIQRHLFDLSMEDALFPLAEFILAFAGTNKENQTYINKNMLAILESLSHTAKAMGVFEQLHPKTFSLPVLQSAPLKEWYTKATNSLHGGNFRMFVDWSIVLHNKNSNPNWGNGIKTCLTSAADLGFSDNVLVLLYAGAHPNLTDQSGKTPLMRAVEREFEDNNMKDIVIFLLEAGANPSQKNKNDDKTAADYALKNGHNVCVKLLEEASLVRKQKLEAYKQRQIKITQDAIIKQWQKDEKESEALRCILS